MNERLPDFLTHDEQALIVRVAEQTTFKPCPPWLGKFEFKCFYGNSIQQSPLSALADRLATIVPDQKFNTAFLQKYVVGSQVFKHRDPKNNTGKTLIALAGEFTGAVPCLNLTEEYGFVSGDVVVQDCTIDGKQGPVHSVSPVLSGVRYAFILNTISR